MKQIVVVGGGLGGLAAARALATSPLVQVTLIDRKDYFEVTYAQLRALVDPQGTGDPSRIPYGQAFSGTFILGELAQVEKNRVVLTN